MRIAANLNVLDEAELIGPCIEHLRAIGVDLIVITDLGSIDGTEDHLAAVEDDLDIVIIRLRRDEDPWGFPGRTYQRTISEFAVDRVLFLDADEFWLPMTGNLQTTASLRDADALSVRRRNVPLVANRSPIPADLSPAGYSEIFLVANGRNNADRLLEQDPNLRWIMSEGAPKTIIDPARVEGTGMGHHQVTRKSGEAPKVVKPDDLIVAHVPFSTASRFTRKLDNIARSLHTFGHRLVGAEAWHWRRWLQIAEAGGIEAEFNRQIMSEEQFQAYLADGTIQSAAAILDAMSGRAVNPNPPLRSAT